MAQVWVGDKNPGICPVPPTPPASGSVALDARDWSYPNFVHTYHLVAAAIPVTDGAASGSHGSYKLATFAEGLVRIDSCIQSYTAFSEGSALTGGAGNAVFKLGVGSAAIAAAADAALTGTSVDVGAATSNITLVAGTGTGYVASGVIDVVLDGRTTPASLNLNFSGTAASIVASSTLNVTGKIVVSGTFLGDVG